MKTFQELQGELAAVMAANTPGAGVPHVVIALPSYSISESLLSHYGPRVMALEHRYLLASLMTHRLPDVEFVYLSSLAPTPGVIDYYKHLGPRPDLFEAHTRFVSVDDVSAGSMAAKLLARPGLLNQLRELTAGRPAVIEPWNVTAAEVAVAEALQLPINGMDPRLWPLGFKSAGRRMFVQAGVPVPFGVEDVRTVDDVVAAVARVRAARPAVKGVVIKHDDSGAGDGNAVIDLREPAGDPSGEPALEETVRGRIEELPGWYLKDLASGGVVEEHLNGVEFTSPSVQVDMLADGSVTVLATHEQMVGGDNGQVFLGCLFPADPAYAGELARHGHTVARHLAAAGVRGRASVDFGAVRDEAGTWRLHALEVNLRKGGTTHPYAALRNLVPGRYEASTGTWISASDNTPRSYVCTDNFVDPAWLNMLPETVIAALHQEGLNFDHRRGAGVVPHMLAGLGIDGRFGLTAIAIDQPTAQAMVDQTRDAVFRATTS